MPKEWKETSAPEQRDQERGLARPKTSDTGKRSMQGPPEAKERSTPDGLKRDRDKLNREIEGGVPKDYAGHHLIGVNEAKDSRVLRMAARHGAYDINNGHNGIALPTEEPEAKKTGLPLHDGRHVKEYTERVAGLLQNLDRRYREAGQAGRKWDDERMCSETGKIENQIRRELTRGELFLQKTDPNRPA